MDIGLAADVGTLQRMPKIVGNDRFLAALSLLALIILPLASIMRELAFTARPLLALEAQQIGLMGCVRRSGPFIASVY